MSYVFKIAKSGSDAKTADDKDLVFSSEFKTMKDAINGTAQYTESAPSFGKVLYTHNLGYLPTFKVYYDNNDGVWHDATNALVNYAGPVYETAICYADTSKLYMDLGPTAPTTYNVKFFIFKNKAQ